MKSRHTGFRWSLVIVALVLLSPPSFGQSAAEKPFLGSWKGNISIMNQNLEIRLVFSLYEAKTLKGAFDSITQGATGLGLGGIVIKGRDITFNIADLVSRGNPTFTGKLDAAGTKITGEFTQSGFTGTFSVEKEKPAK